MSILVMIGTKAQFIKTAPILREMDARGVDYRLVYTGQHSETFDLLEQAFGTRAADDTLVPRFEASTKSSFVRWAWSFWITVVGRVLSGKWRGVCFGLVHGDTASTLFCAIAIRMLGAKVAHVEAGLRSPRLLDPFPEEIIRRLVSRLSGLHFVPGPEAGSNLSDVAGKIVDTKGNTLRDALSMALASLPAACQEQGGGGGYAVVSIHRNENLSDRRIFELLMQTVVDTARRIPVKFVLHPATRARIMSSGWQVRLEAVARLDLLDRMDYPDFVRLLLGSRFLMTDGGSNQEEAAMLGLPTLLLRKATERHDGLGDGVVLSSLDPNLIDDFISQHADSGWPIRQLASGSPSALIVDELLVMGIGPTSA